MEAKRTAPTVEADATSRIYLGQWRGLVSTTNWEKGRIIHEWREALRAGGAPSQEFSDEAWSRRVGNVSGQHAGRLRRVYERFAKLRASYPGLYWSHFQVALDWADAEMWLEGAVQSNWSVADMRSMRWQTLGGGADAAPFDVDVIEAEPDEDAEPPPGGNIALVQDPCPTDQDDLTPSSGASDQSGGMDDVRAVGRETPTADGLAESSFEMDATQDPSPAEASVRPFENLPELPDDVAEAFEAYKLAILQHKLAGWIEISRGDLLASLDALKQLALAP